MNMGMSAISDTDRMELNRKDHLFESIVMPHLGAAFNLASWLLGNRQDAEDVVQESCLRAFKALDSFRGGNARVWLLAIIRNTSYTWLERHGMYRKSVSFEDGHAEVELPDHEAILHQQIDNVIIRQATENLPVEFREVIILRDIEGFSYKEIAGMLGIPSGTVMSRLSRARARLQKDLRNLLNEQGRGKEQP